MDIILLTQSFIIGILSTLIMDFNSLLIQNIFKIKSLNYAWLGRWLLSISDKKLIHQNIMQTPIKKYEKQLGWFLHYLIGILWVFIFLYICKQYNFDLNLKNSLIFSILTTLIPFLILQPLFGFGFFASKTPNQIMSLINSMIAHLSFGIGIYICLKIII